MTGATTSPTLDGSLAGIRAEQVRRWRAGERPPVEDFLSRHPSLSSDTEAVMVLIYGEVLLREELDGTAPEPSEFVNRFPALAGALTAQFDLHRALQSDGSVPTPDVPGFQFVRELGRGGMGVVFLARDENLGRPVAIKLLLSGEFAGASSIERFRTEAEAVARLQHPHVVAVHAFGEVGGRPYLVLEYVPGGTLADRLKIAPLAPRDAAELLRSLADAVEHAHRLGIVHRDLKPANVLLRMEDERQRTESEAVSDSVLRPPFSALISDFGLAKRLDSGDGATATSQLLGTPSYMAPEQCSGAKDVGPAADVYSLGAILYECLTGRPPFKAATAMETLAQVQNREPASPRSLNPAVPRDLDTICLKCLEKSPERRYASAAMLADDLQRFLTGQPVRARPVGMIQRAARWCRRNPAAAGFIAALLIGTIATTGLAIYALNERDRANFHAAQATDEAQRADRESDESYRHQYLAHMTLAGKHVEAGHAGLAAQLIERYRQVQPGKTDPRGWEWNYLDQSAHVFLRTFAGHPPVGNQSDATNRIAFRSAGDWLLTVGGDRTARIWSVATGRPIRAIAEGRCATAAFARNGRSILVVDEAGAVWLYHADTGELEVEKPIIPHARGRIAFSADGQRIAAIDGDEVRIWNTDSGAMMQSLSIGEKDAPGAAFDSSNRMLAIAVGRAVQLWDIAANRRVRVLTGHAGPVWFAACDPDGKRVAGAGQDGAVLIWNVESGQVLHRLGPLPGGVFGLAFSGDGMRLAAGCTDRRVYVWDVETGRLVVSRCFPDGFAQCMAFGPDRATLAVGYMLTGQKPSVYLWDLGTQFPRSVAAPSPASPIAFSPNGDRLLVNSLGGCRVVDTATFQTAPGPAGLSGALRATGTGHVLAMANGRMQIWNWHRGTIEGEFDLPKERPRSMLFSRDGKRIAIASPSYQVDLLDLAGGERTWTAGDGRFLELRAWSPDDRRLAVTRLAADKRCRTVEFWSADTGECISGPFPVAMQISTTRWSPDGSRIAFAGSNGEAAIVDTTHGKTLAGWSAHTGQIDGMEWTPDGRRIITTGWDKAVRLWDSGTAQLLLSWSTSDRPVGVVVSSDGHRVAVGAGDRVWLLDGRPLSKEILVEREALAIFEALGSTSPSAAAERVQNQHGTPKAVRDRVLQWLAANGS